MVHLNAESVRALCARTPSKHKRSKREMLKLIKISSFLNELRAQAQVTHYIKNTISICINQIKFDSSQLVPMKRVHASPVASEPIRTHRLSNRGVSSAAWRRVKSRDTEKNDEAGRQTLANFLWGDFCATRVGRPRMRRLTRVLMRMRTSCL